MFNSGHMLSPSPSLFQSIREGEIQGSGTRA